MPPVTKQSFSEFLWNSHDKTFLGRTGSSWLKITIFYIIFYLCLAAFWVLCLLIFLNTIDRQVPKWNAKTSGISSVPGLSIRPSPLEGSIDSSIIDIDRSQNTTYVSDLEKFLKLYETSGSSGEHYKDCSKGPPSETQYCGFDIKTLGPKCIKEDNFGYKRGTPCVLLKLNRLMFWAPNVYRNASELPSNMPKSLSQVIIDSADSNGVLEPCVWVSCEPISNSDALKEKINYYPNQCFSTKYFPFTGVQGYLSPLIAVQFSLTDDKVLEIECKAWAKNIDHDRRTRRATMLFKLWQH